VRLNKLVTCMINGDVIIQNLKFYIQTGAVVAISRIASFADTFHTFAVTSAEVNCRTVRVVVTATVVSFTRIYLCNAALTEKSIYGVNQVAPRQPFRCLRLNR